MKLIIRIVINAAAIWVTSQLVSGFDFTGDAVSLIIVAVIMGLVNAFIRPIVKLLSLPITLITLGLFSIVINALMLMLTVALSDSLNLGGNMFENFITAIIGSIVISIVSTILSLILPD